MFTFGNMNMLHIPLSYDFHLNRQCTIVRGGKVRVESGAGALASFADEAYAAAGATIVEDVSEAWSADLVLKLNPPTVTEADYLGQGQVYLRRCALGIGA